MWILCVLSGIATLTLGACLHWYPLVRKEINKCDGRSHVIKIYDTLVDLELQSVTQTSTPFPSPYPNQSSITQFPTPYHTLLPFLFYSHLLLLSSLLLPYSLPPNYPTLFSNSITHPVTILFLSLHLSPSLLHPYFSFPALDTISDHSICMA